MNVNDNESNDDTFCTYSSSWLLHCALARKLHAAFFFFEFMRGFAILYFMPCFQRNLCGIVDCGYGRWKKASAQTSVYM